MVTVLWPAEFLGAVRSGPLLGQPPLPPLPRHFQLSAAHPPSAPVVVGTRQPHRSSCARTGPGQQAVRGDLGPERGRYGQSMCVMVQRVAACASRGSAGGFLAVEGVGSGGRRSLLLPNSCSQRQERVTDEPSRRSSTLSSSAAPDRQPTPVFDAQTYRMATRPGK